MQVLLAAVLVVIVVLLVLLVVFGARRWVWRPLVAQRVIVQLDSGHAIEGVLVERRGTLLVLGDATVHEPGERGVKADGRSVVERSRVLWVQVM